MSTINQENKCINLLGNNFYECVEIILNHWLFNDNFRVKFSELNNLSHNYDGALLYFFCSRNDKNETKIINNNDLQIFFGIVTEITLGEKKNFKDIQLIKYFPNINDNFEIMLDEHKLEEIKDLLYEKEEAVNVLTIFSKFLNNDTIPNDIYDGGLFTINLEENCDNNLYYYGYLIQKVKYDYTESLSMLMKEIITKINNESKTLDEMRISFEYVEKCIITNDIKQSMRNLLYLPRWGRLYIAKNSFEEK